MTVSAVPSSDSRPGISRAETPAEPIAKFGSPPHPSMKPAAPDTAVGSDVKPTLSISLRPQIGVVVQLRNDHGDVTLSMPTQKAISAYQISGTPLPSMDPVADTSEKPLLA